MRGGKAAVALGAVGALGAGGLVLGACGNAPHVASRLGAGLAASGTTSSLPGAGSSSGTTAPRTRSSGSSTTKPGLPALPSSGSASGKGASANGLEQLEMQALAASGLTYKASYRSTSAGATLTYAQLGAQTAFAAGQTTYYSDGVTNTVCDTSSGHPVCYTDAKPLTGLLSLISPASAAHAIQALLDGATSVTQSTQSGAQCLAYLLSAQKVKYCINGQGIVSYINVGAGAFKLNGLTASVSSSDVTAP